ALAIAGVAVALAVVIYYMRPALTSDGLDRLQRPLGPLWTFLHRKWLWDEAYHNAVIRPFNALGGLLAHLDVRYLRDGLDQGLYGGFNRIAAFLGGDFDLGIIDRVVNGVGRVTQQLAGQARHLQTGYVRNYALSVMLGVLAVLL